MSVARSTDLELGEHPITSSRTSTVNDDMPTTIDGEVEAIASSRPDSRSSPPFWELWTILREKDEFLKRIRAKPSFCGESHRANLLGLLVRCSHFTFQTQKSFFWHDQWLRISPRFWWRISEIAELTVFSVKAGRELQKRPWCSRFSFSIISSADVMRKTFCLTEHRRRTQRWVIERANLLRSTRLMMVELTALRYDHVIFSPEFSIVGRAYVRIIIVHVYIKCSFWILASNTASNSQQLHLVSRQYHGPLTRYMQCYFDFYSASGCDVIQLLVVLVLAGSYWNGSGGLKEIDWQSLFLKKSPPGSRLIDKVRIKDIRKIM